MAHRFVNTFFVFLFAVIAYYLAFYSHLKEIAPEPTKRLPESEESIASRDAFLEQFNITHNQYCFLENKSSLDDKNATSYFQAIALSEEEGAAKKQWLLCSDCNNGTCIYPTDDTALVLGTKPLWEGYEEEKDYCEERHGTALSKLSSRLEYRKSVGLEKLKETKEELKEKKKQQSAKVLEDEAAASKAAEEAVEEAVEGAAN